MWFDKTQMLCKLWGHEMANYTNICLKAQLWLNQKQSDKENDYTL